MLYRSVGEKIAVDLKSLKLPVDNNQAKNILMASGFIPVEFNLTRLARGLVGTSKYRRGALPHEAPEVVDCSGMVKWIYGQIGIWLPRYSVDQRSMGRAVSCPREGDLIFSAGWRSYYWDNPDDGVGHVGIITRDATVIQAANCRRGVIEEPWRDFCKQPESFRGLRRYLLLSDNCLVLQMAGRRVETSQELRWIILQHL